MLLVIQEEKGIENEQWNVQLFVSCLRLQPITKNDKEDSKTWQNLDGTTMTATPYRFGSDTETSNDRGEEDEHHHHNANNHMSDNKDVQICR